MPVSVYRLHKLEVLLASDNQIDAVDATRLQEMKQLATLDLTNNSISQVPPELGLCTQLRYFEGTVASLVSNVASMWFFRSLQLDGNSFRIPRTAILSKGTLAVLEYLRGRIPS